MPLGTRVLSLVLLAASAVAVAGGSVFAQSRPMTIVAANPAAIRAWDSAVDQMLQSGELEIRRADNDTLVSGRTHTRLRQMYHGVPVYGAELTRQTDAVGSTVSLFGTTFHDIAIDTTPTLSADAAVEAIAAQSGVRLGPYRSPTLVVLPTDEGYRLAYQAQVYSADADAEYFIDANTGAVLLQLAAGERQSAVGSGTGVLSDQKKVSATSVSGGGFAASDALRPPAIITFDMKENLQHLLDILNGVVPLTNSDRASNADNVWADGATVDAHAYAGFMYDYYFKRFNRRGLDNDNYRVYLFVHPVPRASVQSQPGSVVGEFYLNAFWASGPNVMIFGEGLPTNLTTGGQRWNYLSGALDIVSHELTHGVTQFTSALIYQNESGALNEAFSDMMGTAVEFFYQPIGSGLMKADYLIGEDVVTPGGIRSMENPAAYGQPDHYSKRLIVPLSNDNGAVHANSGIPNQMYYLAIEGGTNRTSGLSVQGVGVANREQIEKSMYRGFTQLMPANATFSVARAVTIQAATDLYGSTSNAVRAITQAWTAVGVN